MKTWFSTKFREIPGMDRLSLYRKAKDPSAMIHAKPHTKPVQRKKGGSKPKGIVQWFRDWQSKSVALARIRIKRKGAMQWFAPHTFK